MITIFIVHYYADIVNDPDCFLPGFCYVKFKLKVAESVHFM